MKSSYKIALIAVALLCVGVIAIELFLGDAAPEKSAASDNNNVATAPARGDRDSLPSLTPHPSSTPGSAAATPPPPPQSSSNLFDQVRQRMDQGRIPSSSPSPTTASSPSAPAAPPQLPAPSQAANAAMDAGNEPGHPIEPTTITFGGDQPVAGQLPDSATAIGSAAAGVADTAPVLAPRQAEGFSPGSPTPSVLAAAPAPRFAATAATPTSTAPRPLTPAKTYTIASGDTFTSIAAKLYGSERFWVDIAQANPTVDPHKLRVGQQIRLPAPQDIIAAAAPAAATDAARSTTPGTPGTRSYTIHAGDTLSSIAQRFYGNPDLWRAIYDANRATIGPSPDRLNAGDALTIPDKPQ